MFAADSPVLCRGGPGTVLVTTASDNIMPLSGGISAVHRFESPLFAGTVQAVFRLPPGQQATEAAKLLAGKSRQVWVMIQGRVKHPIALDDLLCGSWYDRPLRLPVRAILNPAIEWLGRRLGGGLDMRLGGQQPHIVGVMAAAAQLLNVSRPGQEPTMAEAEDDARLLLMPGAEGGEPVTAACRRAFFRRPTNRAGRFFTPDMVITTGYFDHSFDYNTFRMSVPLFGSLDMVKAMDAQPVMITMKDRASGQPVLSFEVWHRRMLSHLQAHADRIAPAVAAAKAAAAAKGLAAALADCELSETSGSSAEAAVLIDDCGDEATSRKAVC